MIVSVFSIKLLLQNVSLQMNTELLKGINPKIILKERSMLKLYAFKVDHFSLAGFACT